MILILYVDAPTFFQSYIDIVKHLLSDVMHGFLGLRKLSVKQQSLQQKNGKDRETDYFQREFEKREAIKRARVIENNAARNFDESRNPNGSLSLVIVKRVIEISDDDDEDDA